MWKDLNGMDYHYQISEDGTVRKVLENNQFLILKHSKTKRGYHYVSLRKNNKNHLEYVHRLVALFFIENPYNKETVNHIDGNKDNNDISNLEWTTYSENNKHAYDYKLKGKNEEFYNSKLTLENVKEIKLLGKYTTYQKIADKYGVSKATVRDVLLGKTWSNVVV